jgi:hypothetical protein
MAVGAMSYVSDDSFKSHHLIAVDIYAQAFVKSLSWSGVLFLLA